MINHLKTQLRTWALVLVSWASLCCYSTCSNSQLVNIPIPGSPLSLSVMANPQPLQNLPTVQGATNVTMGDDDVRNIPLPFNFPFFNQTFNNSWMYSNGAISFQGPNAPSGFCCSGLPLTQNMNSGYNYSILPLWTDLIASLTSSSHYVFGTPTSMTYGWYNVSEYGTSSRNSFEVKIDNTGAVDMRYAGAFVSLNHNVTVGMIGNASAGEFYQYYNGRGFSSGALQLSFVANLCNSNPLSDPSCPNYQQAYHDQQCSINPLFATDCLGYQQAYHDQQCSVNPLFATDCLGYAIAYHDQQCSVSPLYATDCPGYAQAYLTQQCNANPLYSTQCSGYAVAYHNQQCSLSPLFASDCPGYDIAYRNKLALDACNANAQSSPNCKGYVAPSATTSISQTTDSTPTAIKDVNVNNVVSSPTAKETTTSPTSPTSVTSVVKAPTTTTEVTQTQSMQSPAPAPAPQMEQKAAEQKSTDQKVESVVASVEPKPEPKSDASSSQDSKPQDTSKPEPKTETKPAASTRDSIKAAVTEKAKDIAKQNTGAKSMEAQIANQSLLVGLMGYVPGFSAYQNSMIKDINGAEMLKKYGKDSVDNRSALRQLNGASDRKWSEIVNSQYRIAE